MATKIWLNIGLGNGLLPGGTILSPEAMSMSVAFKWGHFKSAHQLDV